MTMHIFFIISTQDIPIRIVRKKNTITFANNLMVDDHFYWYGDLTYMETFKLSYF